MTFPGLTLDPKDDLPLYAQLARQLEDAIARGDWPDDRPLPSLRTLVTVLKVNPQTVTRAYQDLETAGLIERRHGMGTFVVTGASSRLAVAHRAEALTRLGALALAARRLGASDEEIWQAVEPTKGATRQSGRRRT